MRDPDRFRGCLIGGAVGDALGYPVEFMDAEEILHRYGDDGIRDYALRGGVAEISDDTQMTLFTATGLLSATPRDFSGSYTDSIRLHYKDWYRTQTQQFPVKGRQSGSWLVNVPELFRRRAPGSTCLSALQSEEFGSLEKPINNSKGCGGVMRVAPIGLYFCDRQRVTLEQSDRIGAEAAAITHGHPLGWLSAAALVHIIRRLAENEKETVRSAVEDTIRALPEEFPETEHMEVQLALLREALTLAGREMDDLTAIRQLGQGWVGEEALAIAVYCALKYPHDFEKAVVAAVNHDGDSDSTGAITGNILGVALGLKAIPEKYLEKLELRDMILELADDLYKEEIVYREGRMTGAMELE